MLNPESEIKSLIVMFEISGPPYIRSLFIRDCAVALQIRL